jgi:hypothetical protein
MHVRLGVTCVAARAVDFHPPCLSREVAECVHPGVHSLMLTLLLGYGEWGIVMGGYLEPLLERPTRRAEVRFRAYDAMEDAVSCDAPPTWAGRRETTTWKAYIRLLEGHVRPLVEHFVLLCGSYGKSLVGLREEEGRGALKSAHEGGHVCSYSC